MRLSGLLLAAIVLQTAVMTQFAPFGVVPDLTPALVACVGLLAGATTGAWFGFATGLLLDLVLLQTLGVSALLLTTVGYLAGMLRELRDPVHPFTAPSVGAVATLLFVLAFAAVQFSLGEPAPRALPFLWQAIVAAALGALLAIPTYRVVRRAMLPSLGYDDPVRRRQRASTVSYRLGNPREAPRRRRRGWPTGRRRGGWR
jgi:rod shape-determining protein MreD